MIRCVLLIGILFINIFTNAQNNILIIDYNNAFSSDRSITWNKSEIYNRLLATNTSVTRINSIPPTISLAYDECWIFGNMGLTSAANLNPVINYINSGGAVYVQSEVSCCPNQAAFVDNIINSVAIAGPLISHNQIKSYKYEATIHPDLVCSPFPLRYGASARLFVGTPANNILFEANSTCGTPLTNGDVIGVRFGACDMISGQGAFIANGDFNIFPQGTCTSTGLLGTPNNNNIIDIIGDLLDSLKVCKTTGCGPLPIELLNFYGENKGDYNQLYWTTSTEINNDFFTIEKSNDAQSFEPIGTLKGAGNSSVEMSYKFEDNESLNDVNYYRLKQTDFNGDYTYSSTIVLNKNLNGAKVYPNPFIDDFNISFYDAALFPIIISVYNLTGQVVWSQTINNNVDLSISLKNQPNGVYLVKIENQETVNFYRQLKN